MSLLSRREFLHDSAALGAALAGADAIKHSLRAEQDKAASQKGDVNDQLRVAIVGVNSRGREDAQGFAGKYNCSVATVCDVDEDVIGPTMKLVEKAQGKAPK